MREMMNYRDYLIKELSDPEEAIVYLEVSKEEYQKDGDSVAFLIALQSIAKAQAREQRTCFPGLFMERQSSPLTKGV